MKLKTRLLLCMLTLFCGLLSVFGSALPAVGFAVGVDAAVEAGLAQHAQAERAFLRAVCQQEDAARAEGWERPALDLCLRAAGALQGSFPAYALYSTGYANLVDAFPTGQGMDRQAQLQAAARPGEAAVYTGDGAACLLCASALPVGESRYILVTGYDLTAVYSRRDQQIRLFHLLYPFFMLLTALVCLLFAQAFTRPLRRLNDACRSIAAGAYSERTALAREDELGELSRSFDGMAASVEEKVESLALSVRQREEFMGALTHELKTPMTAMMGYAALLEREALPPPQRAKALGYIHSETRRLEALSQKLLCLLGIGEEPLALEPVDCAALLAAVRGSLPPAWEAEYRFAWPAPPATPQVQGDADLLADLLRNLVENAVRASAPGSPIEILAEALPDGGLRLGVRDEGRGIPPEALARVTEPFYMVDTSRARAQNGSGLGLALCARIAAAHGGTLHLESEPGRGTCAAVTLPPRPADKEEQG